VTRASDMGGQCSRLHWPSEPAHGAEFLRPPLRASPSLAAFAEIWHEWLPRTAAGAAKRSPAASEQGRCCYIPVCLEQDRQTRQRDRFCREHHRLPPDGQSEWLRDRLLKAIVYKRMAGATDQLPPIRSNEHLRADDRRRESENGAKQPELFALPQDRRLCQPSFPGAKDHHLNRAPMEPSRPSVGGKEVGPMCVRTGTAPGHYHDPDCLPARAAGGGTVRLPIGSGRIRRRRPPPSAASRTAPPLWGDELRALRRLRRESEMSSFVVSASEGPVHGRLRPRNRARPRCSWPEGLPPHAPPRLRVHRSPATSPSHSRELNHALSLLASSRGATRRVSQRWRPVYGRKPAARFQII
jgi:hypothetical protein